MTCLPPERPEESLPVVKRTLIRFDLLQCSYALDTRDISSVEEAGAIEEVSGAPHGVAGLTSSRGRALTVIDLGRVVGDTVHGLARSALVRLAEPFESSALLIHAEIRLQSTYDGPPREAIGRAMEWVQIEGQTVRWLRPERLLDQCVGPGEVQP